MTDDSVKQEMAVAANKIDSRVIDGKLFVEVSVLPEFAATVAAVHRELFAQAAKGNRPALTDAENYQIVGQQNLAITLITLYEAIVLKNLTDEAALGINKG